jgi:hypothetical protein
MLDRHRRRREDQGVTDDDGADAQRMIDEYMANRAKPKDPDQNAPPAGFAWLHERVRKEFRTLPIVHRVGPQGTPHTVGHIPAGVAEMDAVHGATREKLRYSIQGYDALTPTSSAVQDFIERVRKMLA